MFISKKDAYCEMATKIMWSLIEMTSYFVAKFVSNRDELLCNGNQNIFVSNRDETIFAANFIANRDEMY